MRVLWLSFLEKGILTLTTSDYLCSEEVIGKTGSEEQHIVVNLRVSVIPAVCMCDSAVPRSEAGRLCDPSEGIYQSAYQMICQSFMGWLSL